VNSHRPRRINAGFSLLEVLITVVLMAIGLVGLAGLQQRTSVAEMESYQRAQALILAQDMADRISNNKVGAAGYLATDIGVGAVQNCSSLTGTAKDLCTWANAIRGTSETSGGLNVGTLLGGRACITSPSTNFYLVVVVWQGLVPTVAPSVTCGQNSYGTDTFRRAVVVPVRLADLTA
jgi:type IV pilus assembly protein PilV